MSDETNEAGPGDVREVLEARSAMPSEAKGDRTDSVTTVNGRLVVVGTKGGNVRINDGQSIIALTPAAARTLAEHLRAAAERLQP